MLCQNLIVSSTKLLLNSETQSCVHPTRREHRVNVDVVNLRELQRDDRDMLRRRCAAVGARDHVRAVGFQEDTVEGDGGREDRRERGWR